MTPERGHIEQLYRGALALSGEAREAFLAHACAGDPELRRDGRRQLKVVDQVRLKPDTTYAVGE